MNTKLIAHCITDLRSCIAVIKAAKTIDPNLKRIIVSTITWGRIYDEAQLVNLKDAPGLRRNPMSIMGVVILHDTTISL